MTRYKTSAAQLMVAGLDLRFFLGCEHLLKAEQVALDLRDRNVPLRFLCATAH